MQDFIARVSARAVFFRPYCYTFGYADRISRFANRQRRRIVRHFDTRISEQHRPNKGSKRCHGLREIANIIEQNPQMMHPRHLIDIAEDYASNPAVPGFLWQGIMGSLGYALRFFTESEYEKEISSRLDFEHQDNFGRTSRFLELVPALYNVGYEFSYHGDNIVVSRVRKALEDAVTEEKGNYLLFVRARALLEQMDGRDHVWSDQDRTPFLLSGKIYAWHLDARINL